MNPPPMSSRSFVRPRIILLACIGAAFLAVTLSWAEVPAPVAGKVDFAREVLPILSEHCFTCHGPDAGARKGDLRLGTREDALRKNDPVIVPGKSADSELIRRITSSKSDVMPPVKAKKQLSPGQIDTLKRWVDQGAAWGVHWAFVAPVRPAKPQVARG